MNRYTRAQRHYDDRVQAAETLGINPDCILTVTEATVDPDAFLPDDAKAYLEEDLWDDRAQAVGADPETDWLFVVETVEVFGDAYTCEVRVEPHMDRAVLLARDHLSPRQGVFSAGDQIVLSAGTTLHMTVGRLGKERSPAVMHGHLVVLATPRSLAHVEAQVALEMNREPQPGTLPAYLNTLATEGAASLDAMAKLRQTYIEAAASLGWAAPRVATDEPTGDLDTSWWSNMHDDSFGYSDDDDGDDSVPEGWTAEEWAKIPAATLHVLSCLGGVDVWDVNARDAWRTEEWLRLKADDAELAEVWEKVTKEDGTIGYVCKLPSRFAKRVGTRPFCGAADQARLVSLDLNERASMARQEDGAEGLYRAKTPGAFPVTATPSRPAAYIHALADGGEDVCVQLEPMTNEQLSQVHAERDRLHGTTRTYVCSSDEGDERDGLPILAALAVLIADASTLDSDADRAANQWTVHWPGPEDVGLTLSMSLAEARDLVAHGAELTHKDAARRLLDSLAELAGRPGEGAPLGTDISDTHVKVVSRQESGARLIVYLNVWADEHGEPRWNATKVVPEADY